MKITTEQKIKALRRELTMRKALYPHRVKVGTMSQEDADKEIRIFKRILSDYKHKLEGEES